MAHWIRALTAKTNNLSSLVLLPPLLSPPSPNYNGNHHPISPHGPVFGVRKGQITDKPQKMRLFSKLQTHRGLYS